MERAGGAASGKSRGTPFRLTKTPAQNRCAVFLARTVTPAPLASSVSHLSPYAFRSVVSLSRVVCALLVLFPSLAKTQIFSEASDSASPSLSLRAVPVSAANEPRLGGRLDETVWADAPRAGDFVQRLPNPGQPAGGEAFAIRNRGFSFRSLRGNAVLRWEWRPGSALFLMWQQQRTESVLFDGFDGTRELGKVFRASVENVFLIKASYWFGL